MNIYECVEWIFMCVYALHEIDKPHKQNKLDNSIRGNFLKEFVECTRECISELEEKLESLKEWVNALLRLHGKKD